MTFGNILLAGGAEFGGGMSVPDLRAIGLAGGMDARVAIIPTAAAPDQNHQRAGNNGMRWFQSLGATNVSVVPVIDRNSANDPALADSLRNSRLIYLLGGFTSYLVETLAGSLCWQAALEACQSGALIGGSSAGAMALCQHHFDPRRQSLKPGLNLLPNSLVIPHFNTFGKNWVGTIPILPTGVVQIGIDERTAAINDGKHGAWNVYGDGGVTIITTQSSRSIPAGGSFMLP